LGDVAATLAASALLRDHGLQVSAIRPPTVPRGEARLRITLSATHSDGQFEQLLQALMAVNTQYLASQSRRSDASH